MQGRVNTETQMFKTKHAFFNKFWYGYILDIEPISSVHQIFIDFLLWIKARLAVFNTALKTSKYFNNYSNYMFKIQR